MRHTAKMLESVSYCLFVFSIREQIILSTCSAGWWSTGLHPLTKLSLVVGMLRRDTPDSYHTAGLDQAEDEEQ